MRADLHVLQNPHGLVVEFPLSPAIDCHLTHLMDLFAVSSIMKDGQDGVCLLDDVTSVVPHRFERLLQTFWVISAEQNSNGSLIFLADNTAGL